MLRINLSMIDAEFLFPLENAHATFYRRERMELHIPACKISNTTAGTVAARLLSCGGTPRLSDPARQCDALTNLSRSEKHRSTWLCVHLQTAFATRSRAPSGRRVEPYGLGNRDRNSFSSTALRRRNDVWCNRLSLRAFSSALCCPCRPSLPRSDRRRVGTVVYAAHRFPDARRCTLPSNEKCSC